MSCLRDAIASEKFKGCPGNMSYLPNQVGNIMQWAGGIWAMWYSGQCFVLHWVLGCPADEAFILSNGNLGNLTGVATAHLCMGGGGGGVRLDLSVFNIL